MSSENKSVAIKGTNNRYQIKKLIDQPFVPKQRIVSKKWNIDDKWFQSDAQLELLQDINTEEEYKKEKDILKREIINKIVSYKNQDISRNLLNKDKFIDSSSVMLRLAESNLNCYYCKGDILVLYDISREMNQWSIDRIDNDQGHNIDNYHISCLKCNLERKRKSADKFLFTKQLTIIKND
uniref:HNH domain-containing protein n=1 Tax=viral metagenome TaxID=1070528 RepID=A0A6C0LNI3_9ZZZZ